MPCISSLQFQWTKNLCPPPSSLRLAQVKVLSFTILTRFSSPLLNLDSFRLFFSATLFPLLIWRSPPLNRHPAPWLLFSPLSHPVTHSCLSTLSLIINFYFPLYFYPTATASGFRDHSEGLESAEVSNSGNIPVLCETYEMQLGESKKHKLDLMMALSSTMDQLLKEIPSLLDHVNRMKVYRNIRHIFFFLFVRLKCQSNLMLRIFPLLIV